MGNFMQFCGIHDLDPHFSLISKLTKLQSLRLRYFVLCYDDVMAFQYLTKLSSLRLEYCDYISQIQCLKQLTNLQQLTWDCSILDTSKTTLQILTSLSSLTDLTVGRSIDFRYLKGLTHLTHSLQYVSHFGEQELSVLTFLSKLCILTLRYDTNLPSAMQLITRFFSTLHTLKFRNVSDHELTLLTCLERLSHLTKLCFPHHKPNILRHHPFEFLTALHQLHTFHSVFTDTHLHHLSRCYKLRRLCLVGDSVSNSSLLILQSALHQLEDLRFFHCTTITNWEPIFSCRKLTKLSFKNCPIETCLNFMSRLTTLKFLEMNECMFSEQITTLHSNTTLCQLHLKKEKRQSLNDDIITAFLSALTNLQILSLKGLNLVTERVFFVLTTLTSLQFVKIKDCSQLPYSTITTLRTMTNIRQHQPLRILYPVER